MGKFMLVFDWDRLILSNKIPTDLATLTVLALFLMLGFTKVTFVLILLFSLFDCGIIVMRQRPVVELHPVRLSMGLCAVNKLTVVGVMYAVQGASTGGCGVVVRGEPQGGAVAVTQTSDKRVGRVCDPVKGSY